ncbi:MAG: hypothetical protein JNJ73_02790 [Hyphomonadaceae bacterium]|nr:hypothetical protein [Hyphomonadaceae bacterium]
MIDADRKHADLAAGFLSQLGVAFVAGAFLQLVLTDLDKPASAALLFMTGLLLHGVSHITIETVHGATRDRR